MVSHHRDSPSVSASSPALACLHPLAPLSVTCVVPLFSNCKKGPLLTLTTLRYDARVVVCCLITNHHLFCAIFSHGAAFPPCRANRRRRAQWPKLVFLLLLPPIRHRSRTGRVGGRLGAHHPSPITQSQRPKTRESPCPLPRSRIGVASARRKSHPDMTR